MAMAHLVASPQRRDRDARQRLYLLSLFAVALLAGSLLAWDGRFEGDPDGLAYQNIAEQVLRGNYGALSNPYWSPLYPLLNAAILAVLRPAPENLNPSLHIAAVVMYVMAALAFLYFIRQWINATGAFDDEEERFYTLVFFGWCLFLWASLRLVNITYPMPDMLTLACILCAAGICCRIASAGEKLSRYVLLGLVLGVGYIGKFSVAVMTLSLFASMLAFSADRTRTLRNLAVAGAVFLAVAAPLIIPTSRRVGHFSLGESGKLNYAWHVNRSPFLWTGPGGFAAGETPVRVRHEDPLVLEFADASGSTLPIWYDPAYWHSGLRTSLSLRQIAVSFAMRLQELFRIAEDIVPLIAGLWVLAWLRRRTPPGVIPGRELRHLGAWAALICLPFLLVHVEFRYVAGAIFLLAMFAFHLAERVSEWKIFNAVARVVAIAMLTTLIAPTHRAVLHATEAVRGQRAEPEHVIVAHGLRDLGLKPGDAIAVAGYAFDAYYARIAGVFIHAQICDSASYADIDWHDPQASCRVNEFLRRDPSSQAELWDTLRRSGIRAVVTRDTEGMSPPSGWQKLGETHFWARFL